VPEVTSTGLRVGSSCAAAIAFLGACAAFSGSDDAPPPSPAADASADAPPQTDATADGDATLPCSSTTLLFEDDFLVLDVEKWQAVNTCADGGVALLNLLPR
jgi:hypothetical protein